MDLELAVGLTASGPFPEGRLFYPLDPLVHLFTRSRQRETVAKIQQIVKHPVVTFQTLGTLGRKFLVELYVYLISGHVLHSTFLPAPA